MSTIGVMHVWLEDNYTGLNVETNSLGIPDGQGVDVPDELLAELEAAERALRATKKKFEPYLREQASHYV